MKQFHLLVLTPTRKYLETDIDFLSVKSSDFVLGILPNHAPLITTLDIGKMTIKKDNETYHYAVSGGVLHILEDHSVHLLLNAIERSDEIDLRRAEESKLRAEERLNNKNKDIDVLRAKAALARALNRISIYNK